MRGISAPSQPQNRSKILAATVLAVSALLLLARTLRRAINHDEEQYIFAGLLSVDQSLYSEFIYLQMPNMPLLLSAIFAPLDSSYFVAARLVSWAFIAGAMVLIFLLGRAITGSAYAATALSVLFATSTLLLETLGSARNDVMPCFFMLLGLWFFYQAEHLAKPTGKAHGAGQQAAMLYGLCGLTVTVAAGTKISYAFLPAVIFAFLMVRSSKFDRGHIRGRLLPFLVGVGVGGAPILYYALTRWDQFFFQNVTYHLTAPVEWYTRNGMAHKLGLGFQIREAAAWLNRDVVIASAAFIAFIVVAALLNKRSRILRAGHRRSFTMLLLVLLAAAVVFAMLPSPSHPQYFVPVIPLLILLVACFYRLAARVAPDVRAPSLAAVTIVAMVPGFAMLTKDAIALAAGASATQRVQETATAVRRAMAAAGVDGKVATLSPIRIIDGGLSVYPEFSTGPFFYRTADVLTVETVLGQRGMSAKILPAFLDQDPPAAIFTGFETDGYWRHAADAALEAYATARGYRQVLGDFDGGKLFLAPPRSTPARW